MSAFAIDLNADLGEGYLNDARLLELVTSASVCCGAHAGDPETIRATLAAAAARGVVIGAHPGYPDREDFGRRERVIDSADVERLVFKQCVALAALAAEFNLTLRFLKPHGALYNQAQVEEGVARGVLAAARRLSLPVLGQPGGAIARLSKAGGTAFVAEGFPERRYQADGRLVPRSQPDAVLHDPEEIDAQVVRLMRQGLETLCIHGDDVRAPRKAENVRAVLSRNGVIVRFWGA